MADEEPKEESTDNSDQQPEEQPNDSDQAAEQSEEQPVESDQASDQSEELPAAESGQTPQVEQQPAGNDQPAEQSGGGGGGGGSGGGVGGGGPADDAVAADSRQKRPLRVIAEFTQEGKKFIGDTTLDVSEWDDVKREPGKSRFPNVPFFQDTAGPKGNVIDTGPISGGVPGEEVLIRPDARVYLAEAVQSTGEILYQYCSRSFVIPMPSGTDVLPVKFDVEVRNVDPQTVTVDKKMLDKVPGGTEEDAAKNLVRQSPQLKGHSTFDLDATPLGNHKFRVTGKYLTGDFQSPVGRKFIPGL